MVRYFLSNTHKVMTALILVVVLGFFAGTDWSVTFNVLWSLPCTLMRVHHSCFSGGQCGPQKENRMMREWHLYDGDRFPYWSSCDSAHIMQPASPQLISKFCFTVWAGFPEQQREGQKYVVAERPVRRGPRNICADTPAEVANQRRQNVEFAREDWLLSEAIDDTGKDNGSEVVAEHPIKSFTRMGQASSLNTLFDW